MFALEAPDGANTQELKSYMSVYLWMLGYIKRLEKQGQGDKFTAANKMLQNFAEFDKQPWQTKMSLAANLIGMDSFEMLQTTSLQKEGKSFLANQNKVQNFLHFNKSTER